MILKVIFVGLCVCVINIVLRQHNSTFSLLLNIIYLVSVVLIVINSAYEYMYKLKDLFEFSAYVNEMLKCLFKGAMICIVTKIACSLCDENGNKTICDAIDLTGRVVLLATAFPFIESIIKTAVSFVK